MAKEGFTIPIRATQPDVNPDEILGVLDTDTRDYLQLLVNGVGRGLEGRGGDLRDVFARFEPTHRDLARVNGAVADAAQAAAPPDHVAQRAQQGARVARRRPRPARRLLRRRVRLVRLGAGQRRRAPCTSCRARCSRRPTRSGASRRSPSCSARRREKLRPAARALDPANEAVRPFAREATPQLRKSIRPFVRESRPLVRDLRPVSERLAEAAPGPDAGVPALQPLPQPARLQPERPRGPRQRRPPGGLPVLAGLAEPLRHRSCSRAPTPTARSARSRSPRRARRSQQVLQAQPELEFTSVLTPLLTDSTACNGGDSGGGCPELPELPDLTPAKQEEARQRLMQTSVPSFSRVMVMVVFALSCFGLLLFLWLSFGGPIPLKPKGYRVQVGFPEATQLGLEADVRVAGVSVGKLRKKELDPSGNRTLVDLEIDRKFAPLQVDTKAILRQKSLLGETYVELTPGSSKKTIPEGGRLPERPGPADGRARRDLPGARPVDARGVPHLAAGPRRGHQRARARLQRRARHAARLRQGRRRRARGARRAGGRGQPARQEHRRDVRRADRERAAALEPDHLRRPRLRRHRLAAGQPRRDDPHLPDLPRRVARRRSSGCRRSRRTRSR